MTCLEIVRQYLQANGYDGLCDEDECGCTLADLAPCAYNNLMCSPAYDHGPGEIDGELYDHRLFVDKPEPADKQEGGNAP